MSETDNLRDRLRVAIRDAWSTRPTCWDRQVNAVMAVRDEDLEQVQAERDALAAQVAAVRTIITEDYGTNYNDEDVPAAVERLMRHLSAHEANVQRILQAKNEALEQAQAERDELRQHVLDIDAHATPFGDLPDEPGYVGTYLVTAGALHRALGKIGHTAPKCEAEAQVAALQRELAEARVGADATKSAFEQLWDMHREICPMGAAPDDPEEIRGLAQATESTED